MCVAKYFKPHFKLKTLPKLKRGYLTCDLYVATKTL